MLSRRNIRTKVMQGIYAYEQEAFTSFEVASRVLNDTISQAFSLYLYNLHIIRKISERTLKIAEIKKDKHLPTDEDRNFSAKLAENEVTVALAENPIFQKMLERRSLHLQDNSDIVRELYTVFGRSAEYINYVGHPEKNLGQDKNILKRLFNKVMLEEEMYQAHLEEIFSNAADDMQVVKFKINDFLNDYEEEKSIRELASNANSAEDKSFANDLFKLTIERNEELLALISPKLVNWEADRLAKVDVILLKMAVSELMFFKYIPVKVTINEYIDIAKVYSTPRSKDFINGVLDKLMKELQDTGKIKKAGRGLIG